MLPLDGVADLAQLALLRAGLGIGGMQDALAARERDLVPVMHEVIRLPMEMWLVMHEDLRQSRRVRLLFDHLFATLSVYAEGKQGRRARAGGSRR